MISPFFKTALMLVAAAALVGCAVRPHVPPSHPRDLIRAAAVNPSLVTPGGELQEFAFRDPTYTGWELSRNDGPLREWELPIFASWFAVEVRHTEHLRTISGRPREFTSTVTRTIERSAGQ